jgi:hypothetical protein|tara:strand:+ start:1724 stop:1948 length:225 start_codon:yes stop_codon:yes gene_type:complete
MTEDKNLKVGAKIDIEQMKKLNKTYKKLKKYMKSSLFEIRSMDGTENTISKILKDYGPESQTKSEDNTTERTGG